LIIIKVLSSILKTFFM